MATTCWHCHSSHKPMPMTFICSESWDSASGANTFVLRPAPQTSTTIYWSCYSKWKLCFIPESLSISLFAKGNIENLRLYLDFSMSQKFYSHLLFMISLLFINSLQVFWLWIQYYNTWKKWSCVNEKLDTSSRQKKYS